MLARALVPGLGLLAVLAFGVPLPLAAQSRTVVITKADCDRLVKHVPAPDVTYQAGTDVYGRRVAPADLNGGAQIDLPETYSFVVKIQPVAFAERRRIANERAALAEQIANNSAEAAQLAGEAAALADRESAIQNEFEAGVEIIVNNTGGPNETDPAVLAARTALLAALETNTIASQEFIDLQQDITANQQAQALNAQDANELQVDAAALDRDQALIDRRGLNETTMDIGTVTLDLDGRVYFNGQPLTGEEQAELAAKCQRILRGP